MDTVDPHQTLLFQHQIPLVIDFKDTLYPDRIEVTGSRTWIPKIESVIWLKTLSINPSTIWVRSAHFQWSIILLMCIALVSGGILPGAGLGTVPFILVSLILMLPPIVYAYSTRKLIRYARFSTHPGAVVLDIGDAGPEPERFDAFVQELIQRIHASQSFS